MGRPRDCDVAVEIGQERIIMRDAYYPSLHRFADGSMVMTGSKKIGVADSDLTPGYDFRENPELLDTIRAGDLYFSAIRSSDDGKTWRPVAPHPYKGKPSSKGVLYDGTALAMFARTHAAEGQEGVYTGKRWISGDHWETVAEEPITIRCPQIFTGYADQGPTDVIDGPCFHTDFLTMPNGDLIAAVMANFEADTRFTTTRIKWRSILIRSVDDGASWDYVSTIASMASLEADDPSVLDGIPQGFAEPSIALLPDGDLVCALRTGVNATPVGPVDSYHDLRFTDLKDGQYHTTSEARTQPLYVARSTDGGETWCKQERIDSAAGGCPRLLALSNGVLALAYGRTARPSQGGSIQFSVDGGHTWGNETVVYPGMSSGYVEMMEIATDTILYVFDACRGDGPKIPDWIGAVDIEVRLSG